MNQFPMDRRSVLGRMLAGATALGSSPSALSIQSGTAVRATNTTFELQYPLSLQSNGLTQLSASIRNADGSLSLVQAQWSSDSPAAASVSRSGVLAAGTVVSDTVLTIAATVVDRGQVLTASRQILITAAPSRLNRLDVLGSSSLQSGAQLRLRVMAHYEDQSYRQVRPSGWTLHSVNSEAITVILSGGLTMDSARGTLKINTIDRQYALDISAHYTEGDVTLIGRLDLVASNLASTLTGLKIVSLSAAVQAGESLNLTALGEYADQSIKPVAPVWQVDSDAATIGTDGKLTAVDVSQDTPVVVTATFFEAGIASSSELSVLVRRNTDAAALSMALELEAAGPRSRYSLATWVRLTPPASPLSAALPAKAVRAVGGVNYRMYVVAIVPGATVQSGFYMLNRSKEWSALGFPLAEYMAGMVESQEYLVDIFDQIDSRMISGTVIYIGYGTSDTEMLANRRYRLLQVL